MVDGKGTHGGYCGSAVKPIALNMVAEIARTPETQALEISGIGGITTWKDAAEFMALGANAVQVCTAAMIYGFRVVDDLMDGMSQWMDDQGYTSVDQFTRKAVPQVANWNELNMNFDTKAVIDPDKCIECGRCHIACEDTSHQAIAMNAKPEGGKEFVVIDAECVGCNLCYHICPVPDCITMEPVKTDKPYMSWPQHPLNPMRDAAE
jgi:dihydropyrimidine dehydrogenase (NAD+) subunit PreA